MLENEYVPFLSKIKAVVKHTEIEYTFRMSYEGDVKPGQFFEVSIPKFGEAPISVSGIGDGTVDLTIRRVGQVTNEIFERFTGESLFLRGPYGNGFNLDDFRGKDLVVIAGGTGLSPVRGVVDHFARHPRERGSMTLIAGFKSPSDILFSEDIKRWEKTMNVILTVDCADECSCYRVGLVTKYIPELKLRTPSETAAIVVGPPMMMKFSTRGLIEAGFQEENIWISQERRMCCGIGKCGHCKIGAAYVCLDGPVFNYVTGKSLID
ncbi:MAG: anaerobic sulfite reductase subunit AsrB [Synergistaceae bacterium]|nr:anaerobic sulfite reductase subunit AsrB [Synergistaceae bacterium]